MQGYSLDKAINKALQSISWEERAHKIYIPECINQGSLVNQNQSDRVLDRWIIDRRYIWI